MKKAQASSKTNLRFKKDVRDKEREAHKMRKDIIDLKAQNDDLSSQVRDFKQKQANQLRNSNPPRLQSAKPIVSSSSVASAGQTSAEFRKA